MHLISKSGKHDPVNCDECVGYVEGFKAGLEKAAAHLDDTASNCRDFDAAVYCKVLAETVRQLKGGRR